MDDRRRIVAITGANGYVGSLLRRSFAAADWRVVSLIRRPAQGDMDAAHYDLRHEPPATLLQGIDTLILCAWDLLTTRSAEIWRFNVRGTAALLELAKNSGTRRVIFVSSMSAYDGTGQIYGRSKIACEDTATQLGHCVVRLGLVYGPGWGGMAGAMVRMTRLPITPLLAGKSYQYTVHEEDVCTAIVRLADIKKVPLVPLGIAHPEPIKFESLIRQVGLANGHMPRLVPIPWQAAYVALSLCEAAKIPTPFRADSLLGLARPAPQVPSLTTIKELGLSFRPFSP